jgi:hypothetical protein
VTRVATAELASAEAKSVPRVGYLVYRVERRLRSRLDEELRRHGVSTPEYVTRSLLRERDGLSCAHSLEAAHPPPRPRPLGGGGGAGRVR